MKIVSDSLEQKIGVTRVSERDVHVSMHVLGGQCGGACIHARVCVYISTNVYCCGSNCG